MGKWVERANRHVCVAPVYAWEGDIHTIVGDVWECDCGIRYRVVSVGPAHKLYWELYKVPGGGRYEG